MNLLVFIVYDKVHIVTTIAFDESGVTILININLLIQQIFTICFSEVLFIINLLTLDMLGIDYG